MSKNKPGKALNVLIIDDNLSFVEGLQWKANPFRIRLEHETNLEDGLAKLQEKGERYFAGVILDVICLKDSKQQIADEDFLPRAMKEFDRLAPNLPKVILSGEPTTAESVKRLYKATANTYHKSADQIEEMLAYLVTQSENLPHIRIAKRYPDIFWLFDNGYLNHDIEQKLISVLEKMVFSESNVISSNLVELRKIQEAIYLALNRHNPDIVLNSDIEEKGPKCRDIMTHLLQKRFVERRKIIDRASDLLYSISSDYGAHVPNSQPDYPPSKYTVQMCTFAMLDLLIWYRKIVEKI